MPCSRSFAACSRRTDCLSFTTLGPDTLRELRSAWAEVDSRTHVNQFIDMHDIGDALVRGGFASPVLDVERYTLTYLDRAPGCRGPQGHRRAQRNKGRPKGLTGRRQFAAVQTAYEAFRQDGRLPATYEVVFGHAWMPAADARRKPRMAPAYRSRTSSKNCAPGAAREALLAVNALAGSAGLS